MKERWKLIPGDWKYQYYVSSEGGIARKKKSGGYTVFRNSVSPNCYKQVRLKMANGKYCQIYAHRLVAEAFLERPQWANVVHHINHDRSDNRLQNLMWSTQSDNIRFSWSKRREQQAEAGGGGVVGPAPLLCGLPLAGVGSPEKNGSPSPSGRGEQVEVPSPQVLPLPVFSVSWCVSRWENSCFDPRPEHRYTTNGQAGVGP